MSNFYVPYYAATGSTRTQSLAPSDETETTLAVTERAKLFSTSTHTATASRAAVENATWSLLRGITSIGSVTILAGQTTGNVSLSANFRLEPGDTLRAFAPSGDPFFDPLDPFLPAPTVSLDWSFRLAAFLPLPELSNRAFVNFSGTWREAKQIWVSKPVGLTDFEWVRAWKVPDPPVAGVAVSIQQEFLQGGDVIASWTNAAGSDDMNFEVQWEINSFIWGSTSGAVNGAGVGQSSRLLEEELSGGDEVRARMRYVSGGDPGDYGDWSDSITYIA